MTGLGHLISLLSPVKLSPIGNRSPMGVAPLWTGLPTRKVAVHSVAPGAPLGGGFLGFTIPVPLSPGQWEWPCDWEFACACARRRSCSSRRLVSRRMSSSFRRVSSASRAARNFSCSARLVSSSVPYWSRIWAWPSAFPTGILPNSDPSPPRSKTRWSCCGALLGLQGESARWVAGASCAGCSTSSRHLRAESCPAAPRPHRPRAHLHSKTAESPRVVERRRAERRVGCRRRRPNRLLHHARGCRAA